MTGKRILSLLAVTGTLHLPALGGDLKLIETNDIIKVTLRDKPVLEYKKTKQAVPEGVDEVHGRSGYIHPLYSPNGEIVTGDFAPDHPHQRGIFFAWTSAEFDGKQIDFWNLHKKKGAVEHREVISSEEAEDHVSFTVKQTSVAFIGDKKVDALHDTWTVTVYETPADYYLFDIHSVQECASDKPLILPKHKYGGMALRASDQWIKEKDDKSINPGDLVVITSEGKDRWEGNHTRTNWVAFTGKIDERDTTIAVLGSPNNFRAPQHVRTHPDKPYFCFAPEVAGDFKIEPGQKYISDYRFYISSEPASADKVEKFYQDYVKSLADD